MQVGDVVKFQKESDGVEMVVTGQIIKGPKHDFVKVREIHAASIWGISDNAQGEVHKVHRSACNLAFPKE